MDQKEYNIDDVIEVQTLSKESKRHPNYFTFVSPFMLFTKIFLQRSPTIWLKGGAMKYLEEAGTSWSTCPSWNNIPIFKSNLAGCKVLDMNLVFKKPDKEDFFHFKILISGSEEYSFTLYPEILDYDEMVGHIYTEPWFINIFSCCEDYEQMIRRKINRMTVRNYKSHQIDREIYFLRS